MKSESFPIYVTRSWKVSAAQDALKTIEVKDYYFSLDSEKRVNPATSLKSHIE